MAIAILATWTHKFWWVEVTNETITQINQLPDEHVVEAINELRCPQTKVQGTHGNKLKIPVILTIFDKKTTFECNTLLNSGCTGSCINKDFVKNNNIITKKLPRPIPVYNADGTLKKNGSITETVSMKMVVQNHAETITFSVSSLGQFNVFIEHEWLVKHNPNIDWD